MDDRQSRTFRIDIDWDGEAEVFTAHSDDIYGLNTEAATIPELVDKVLALAPELLELNGVREDLSKDNLLFDPRSFLVSCQ